MGWSQGSHAGPQPISFKSQESAGDSDGVEASTPFHSPHWIIEPEGRQSVSCTGNNVIHTENAGSRFLKSCIHNCYVCYLYHPLIR